MCKYPSIPNSDKSPADRHARGDGVRLGTIRLEGSAGKRSFGLEIGHLAGDRATENSAGAEERLTSAVG
jgi:hypothetical protein